MLFQLSFETLPFQKSMIIMMIVPNHALELLSRHLWAVALCAWLLYLIRNRYCAGLSSIPGPFLAGLTDFWLLVDVARGNSHKRLLNLHKYYNSSIVRVGPRKISVSDPELVPKIYGFDPLLSKSDLVHVFRTPCNGKFVPSLFNTSDEAYHTKIKRPFANAYNMSTLVEFEPKVDSTMELFEKCLDRFVESGQKFDLPWWLQAYAFDVLGEICFSKKLGFLDTGKDVMGIIADVKQKVSAGIVMTQVRIVGKTLVGLAARLAPTHPIVQFCLKCLNERKGFDDKDDTKQLTEKKDFLSRCFNAQLKYPNIVDDDLIRTVNVDNIMAGSDTTAITISAVIYHLMKRPECLALLRTEIDKHEPSELVTWREASSMPYLQACIKEGLRIHPVLALSLERIVPEGGLTLSGIHFPEGTIIGCNPYVVSHDDKLFPDPEAFRPERWLEASAEALSAMDKSSLAFGGGKRICIGKNIAMLEMSKLIPQLLRGYDFEFEGGVDKTSAVKSWFTWIENFRVVVRKRTEC